MSLVAGENPTLGFLTKIENAVGFPELLFPLLTAISNPTGLSSIQYVAPSGNDTNNGLSWATAKLTISGALVALPGGSAGQCGSGIIYFADSVQATSVIHQGLWLMGPNDPNYSNLPTGWLKLPSEALSIIGVPTVNYGPTAHLGRAAIISGDGGNNLAPGVWISSSQQAPIYFSNVDISYPARAWVIGVDSNNAITPANSGVVGVTFNNCTGSTSQNTGLGPTWTIGGESYWLEFIDCGGAGSIGANGHVSTDDSAQAFLIDGRGSSGGQIINFRGYTNLDTGGIKFYAGSNDISQVSIEDATEEGSFSGTSPVAPVYWVASGGQGNIVRIGSALIADGGSTNMPAIQNDGDAQIFVTNAWGVGINVQGPVVTAADYGLNYQDLTVSPAQHRQAGFFGSWGSNFKRIFGQLDDTRSNAIAVSRFVNTAPSSPASWSATNGGVTVTTGIADKFGGTNAARISNTNSFEAGINFISGNVSFSVGDWIIIGCWIRSNSGNGNIQSPLSYSVNTAGFTINSTNMIQAGSFIQGDGEWQYLMNLAKVTSIGTNPCAVEFQGLTDSTHTSDLFMPVALHIANGTISDNEAYIIAMSLSSNRSDAPVNSVSVPSTMKLMADGLQMPKITTSVSAPGAEMGFLRWEAGTNAGTLKLVAYAGTSTTGVTVTDNIGAGN